MLCNEQNKIFPPFFAMLVYVQTTSLETRGTGRLDQDVAPCIPIPLQTSNNNCE